MNSSEIIIKKQNHLKNFLFYDKILGKLRQLDKRIRPQGSPHSHAPGIKLGMKQKSAASEESPT